MSKTIAEKIIQAKTTLLLDHPFWGALLCRIEIVEDESVIDPGSGTPTIGTNGLSIRYHPEALKNRTVTEVIFLLAHEVGHLVGEHCFRRDTRDSYQWNVAGDFAINDILQECGFTVLPHSCLDPKFHGKSAEEIYQIRQSQSKKKGNQTCDCKLADGPANSAIDVKVAVWQAAQAAKAMGKLPATLERILGELLSPKIDWKAQLHQFIQQTAKADYSWTRPSQRYLGAGLYLPCLKSESMPPIVVAIDTSGSIGEEELKQFASELNAIVSMVKPEVTHVLYVDAAVAGAESFQAGEPLVFKPCGGGGTDFKPAFDYVKTNGIEPACLIYLTDLCGTFPDTQPDYPVLWVTMSKDSAPFGEVVRM